MAILSMSSAPPNRRRYPGKSSNPLRNRRMSSGSGMTPQKSMTGIGARTVPSAAMRATIQQHNGAPALFIDGRPHSAFSYMTYAPDARWFEQFGEAGVTLQSLPVSADRLQLWGMREVWTARNTVDHSQTDQWIEMICGVVPDALLFPR